METRDVIVVDAFGPEPMTGTPVGVVLDAAGLAPDQRERVAGEFGAPITAFLGREGDGRRKLRLGGPLEDGPPPQVGVALAAALRERGDIADGEVVFALPDRELSVSLGDDGRTWTEVDEPDLREAAVPEEEAASALGIDVAAIRDVAADFPIVRASLGRGVLVVPVNFLEHLSGADPDPTAIAEVLETATAESVYAFTFDTLAGDRDAHGLAVDANGRRLRATGEAEACAAAAIRRYGALDHDRDVLRFEAGDLLDRPARIDVRTGDEFAVGGRSVTVLTGSVVVPPAEEGGDIIEV